MSYLLDFVKTFTAEELEQFGQINLQGKEKLLRDEYKLHAAEKKFNEDTLAKKMGLSKSHFDKINSVLLDKTINAFYGGDYGTALDTLLRKGLSDLMLHELKIAERKMFKEKKAGGDITFYKAAFDLVRRMFHPHYNSQLAHKQGKKYLAALGNKTTIAHEAYVALFTHQADMIAQSVAGNENTFRPYAQAVITEWEKRLKNQTDPTANFIYNYTVAQFIKYYGSEVDLFLKALEKGLYYLTKCNKELQNIYTRPLLCELGFGYVESNKFDKAYEYYYTAFEIKKSSISLTFYPALIYMASAILSNRLIEAKAISHKYLVPFLTAGVNRSVRFDVLLNLSTLNLHLGNYEQAFEYINEIRAYRKNEISQLGQIYLRLSETLYFYKTRQYDLALAIGNKNMKYLNALGKASGQSDYFKSITNCIVKLIKQKQGFLQSPRKLEEQKAALQQGLYSLYNTLL